jgi:hypothetical protein
VIIWVSDLTSIRMICAFLVVTSMSRPGNPDAAKSQYYSVNCLLITNVTEHPEEQSTQLIVGCFCALGKHRSVAFVEELARKQWPDDWDVEVRHRDVDQSKGKDKNQRHKQSRKENRRFVGLEPEQD